MKVYHVIPMAVAMITALYIFYTLWRDNKLDKEEKDRTKQNVRR